MSNEPNGAVSAADAPLTEKSAEITVLAGRLSRPPSSRPTKRLRRALAWLLLVAAAVGGYWIWRATRPLPVNIAAVTYQRTGPAAHPLLRQSGFVRYPREATIGTALRSPVTEIRFEEGLRVRRGDLLARLEHAEALARQAMQHVDLADAEATLARTKRVHDGGAASDAELQRAVTAVERAAAALDLTHAEIANASIYAPFSGIVTTKLVDLGELPVEGICRLIDDSQTLVAVDVSQDDLSIVGPTQAASVTLDAFPSREYPARVHRMRPEADEAKNTVEVEVLILEPDERFKPGMSATVYFVDAIEIGNREVRAVLAVDSSAVVRAGEKRFVWLIEDERVRRREVVTGEILADRIVVSSGLRENDQVVSGLQRFRLVEGKRVTPGPTG